jgi:hypothetical protein
MLQPIEHAKTLSDSVDDLNSELVISHEEIQQGSDENVVATLNGQATVLLTQFEKEGKQSDLGDAIAFFTKALRLCPAPLPDRSMSLNNLATALWTRFEQEGHKSDLDNSISLHREALTLCSRYYPPQSMTLNKLATALQTRFEQEGQENDLDDSICLHREALALCPEPCPL